MWQKTVVVTVSQLHVTIFGIVQDFAVDSDSAHFPIKIGRIVKVTVRDLYLSSEYGYQIVKGEHNARLAAQ